MFSRVKIVFIILSVFLIVVSPFDCKIAFAENPDSVVKYTISDAEDVTVPRLIRIDQTSEDCLKITYSEKVELEKALDLNNYWIQNLKDKEAKDGISSLGKKEKICKENSLSKDNVTITNEGDTGKIFVLKFKKNIPQDSKYRMTVHCVTTVGGKPYTGSNGVLNITTKR